LPQQEGQKKRRLPVLDFRPTLRTMEAKTQKIARSAGSSRASVVPGAGNWFETGAVQEGA
jgi:hypothetical protein